MRGLGRRSVSTIKDVAHAAGVSVATVSRALRGVDSVRPQTRDRIQRLAAEMDFVASPTAASLVSGRTKVIAVVAPSRTRWDFAPWSGALTAGCANTITWSFSWTWKMRVATPAGGCLKQCCSSGSTASSRSDVPVDEGELTMLDRLDLPLVAVGTPVPGRSLIRIDEVLTARMATEHLIGLGHARIAFVGIRPDTIGRPSVATTPARLQGSRCTSWPFHPAHFIIDAGWTALSASLAVSELLQAADRPTAVMTVSDEVAMGVLQAARRLGLRIPHDLSVIGIDDHVFSDVMDLTTMRQDLQAQGEMAAEMLLQRVRNPTIPAVIVTTPTELVLRGTTGSPGHERTDLALRVARGSPSAPQPRSDHGRWLRGPHMVQQMPESIEGPACGRA